jgi:hypothetical protein
MSGNRWICPHCEHAAYVDTDAKRSGTAACTIQSADGPWVATVNYVVCPNPECKRTTINLAYGKGVVDGMGYIRWSGSGSDVKRMRLRPATYARPMPEYVPAPVREDYLEACAILDLSPKAAATLARRALQGMIRHFHGIVKGTLAKEIEALKEKVDPLVWQAIDAVRGVGNIGAHMEKDIDLIIDVEPDEALKLIRLIELLVKEWYVAKHNREQELAAIIALNAGKQEKREGLSAGQAGDTASE